MLHVSRKGWGEKITSYRLLDTSRSQPTPAFSTPAPRAGAPPCEIYAIARRLLRSNYESIGSNESLDAFTDGLHIQPVDSHWERSGLPPAQPGRGNRALVTSTQISAPTARPPPSGDGFGKAFNIHGERRVCVPVPCCMLANHVQHRGFGTPALWRLAMPFAKPGPRWSSVMAGLSSILP